MPHPPFPKEKVVKEIRIIQMGESIVLEIKVPEVFEGGNLEIFFTKTKNPQKKEMPVPPESAVFNKNNLILKENIKDKVFQKYFKKEELKIEYNFSTFWGFNFQKGKEKERTKVFQFLFLEPIKKPSKIDFQKIAEGIEFQIEGITECGEFLVNKETNGSNSIQVNLKKKAEGIFIDENVIDGSHYKYSFFCYGIDRNHLSEPYIIEILYKNELKPFAPEEVIILEEKDRLRIEFKKVLGAIKYKLYEKCPKDENWKPLGESEKEIFFVEKKFCLFGVSSVNPAGIESEIVQAKEY